MISYALFSFRLCRLWPQLAVLFSLMLPASCILAQVDSSLAEANLQHARELAGAQKRNSNSLPTTSAAATTRAVTVNSTLIVTAAQQQAANQAAERVKRDIIARGGDIPAPVKAMTVKSAVTEVPASVATKLIGQEAIVRPGSGPAAISAQATSPAASAEALKLMQDTLKAAEAARAAAGFQQ